MLEELKPWQSKLEIYTQTYGETKVTLDISNCFREECNIGNFVTDAMIDTVSMRIYQEKIHPKHNGF